MIFWHAQKRFLNDLCQEVDEGSDLLTEVKENRRFYAFEHIFGVLSPKSPYLCSAKEKEQRITKFKREAKRGQRKHIHSLTKQDNKSKTFKR